MPGSPAFYDAILFDFDGVLADTEPLHFACWREVLQTVDLDLSWDYYAAECIGVSDRAMLEVLGQLRKPPISLDVLWPLYPRKKELFRDRSIQQDLIDPGVMQLIRDSPQRRFAVVTSSGRAEVEPLLRRAGLLELLGAAVYREDVSRLKPDPEPYATAAQRLGAVCPVVFEDSDAGVASGTAAGFDVVRLKHAKDLRAKLAAALVAG